MVVIKILIPCFYIGFITLTVIMNVVWNDIRLDLKGEETIADAELVKSLSQVDGMYIDLDVSSSTYS